MSEQQEERPLSRRELREQRLGIVSSPSEEDTQSSSEEFTSEATDVSPDTSSIPMIKPDGTPLSRREMRQVWLEEQAKKEPQSQDVPPSIPPMPVEKVPAQQDVTADTVDVPRIDSAAEIPVAPASPVVPMPVVAPAPPAAPAPPVMPVAQEAPVIPVVPVVPEDAPAVSSPFDDIIAIGVQEVDAAIEEEALEAQSASASPVEASSVEEELAVAPQDHEDVFDDNIFVGEIVAEHPVIEVPVTEVPAVEVAVVEEVIVDEVVVEEVIVEEKQEESLPVFEFPTIQPDADETLIHADPATVTVDQIFDIPAVPDAPSEPAGDFDDIISRAVAAEGVTTSSNALILPLMPESSDLKGALNETGEIYITGSIELPRSLGETGGHASLHDTVDNLDSVLGDLEAQDVAPDDTRPIAASQAISAQASNNSLVTPATKSGGRLPVVLFITAGGLVVGIVGLVIYGSTSGLFG